MYVCLCNPVTERAIRHAARNGCRSFAQLQADTGVAMGCGQCRDAAQRIFGEARMAAARDQLAMRPPATAWPLGAEPDPV